MPASVVHNLVEKACRHYGIPEEDSFLVHQLVQRSPTTWPACCGNGCTPCAEELIAAAERVCRELADSKGASCE